MLVVVYFSGGGNMTNLFIPKKLMVGFQKRGGTYNGRLAYVIYYDERGKLRKEKSWQSWRHDDIEPVEMENMPFEGFVLNKKAGGYTSHWNTRKTYSRVYDPRGGGFEFEIDITNLLFILEHLGSQPGKAIQGELVYAWNGTELVLLPTNSLDYQEAQDISKKMLADKALVKADMIEGARYLMKDGEIATFMCHANRYAGPYTSYKRDEGESMGKYYWFCLPSGNFSYVKSLRGNIIERVGSDIDQEYPFKMDALETNDEFCPKSLDDFEYIKLNKPGYWDKIYLVPREEEREPDIDDRVSWKSGWGYSSYSQITFTYRHHTYKMVQDELKRKFKLYKRVAKLQNGRSNKGRYIPNENRQQSIIS